MNRAIELAKKGRGHTLTNPLVGCVIVRDGKIIAEGYHHKFGDNHAEVDAINSSEEDVCGATLYVNLEPCSHYGKTPPCAERIIREGIKRVVIANVDVNEKVSGRGIEMLKEAGIEVDVGVCKNEAEKLNEIFFTHIKNKRPFVLLKAAESLDGKIATYTGDSKWISSEKSREYAHRLRGDLDAIMVGINTILIDNPRLNTRIDNLKDPIKIIVDSTLKIPEDAQVLKGDVIIATTENFNRDKFEKIKNRARIIVTKGQRVNLKELLYKLYELNIGSILLEGGGELNFSMLSEKLVDKINIFISPIIIGGGGRDAISGIGFEKLKDAPEILDMEYRKIDRDILVEGYLRW